jgi:hypothetical protein
VAAIVYLFVKNVSPQPPCPANLAIWISIGWLVVGLLAMAGPMIFKPARLAEAAAIIGEAGAGRSGPGWAFGAGLGAAAAVRPGLTPSSGSRRGAG